MNRENPKTLPLQNNWQHFLRTGESAFALAPPPFVDRLRVSMASEGISVAVRSHDTGPIFDWIMGLVPLQGISDGIALHYSEQHGRARLAQADPGIDHPDRGPLLRAAVLHPLCEIHGIGPKLWAMILADLLLGADSNRERWVTAGTWMIAIDSLVHNFLHRTGTLTRFGAEHPLGPGCTAPGGCRDLIEGLARRIDARTYNPDFPATFPRFVQAALWSFCAEGGWGICNGNRIDDSLGCYQLACPNFEFCDRRGVWQRA